MECWNEKYYVKRAGYSGRAVIEIEIRIRLFNVSNVFIE